MTSAAILLSAFAAGRPSPAEDQLTAEAGPLQITFVPISGTFTLWIDQQVFLEEGKVFLVTPQNPAGDLFVEKPTAETSSAGGTDTITLTMFDTDRNPYPFQLAWKQDTKTLIIGGGDANAPALRLEAFVSAPADAIACRMTPGPNPAVAQSVLGAVSTGRCNALFDPASGRGLVFDGPSARLTQAQGRWSVTQPVSPKPARIFHKNIDISEFTPIPAGTPPPPPGWMPGTIGAEAAAATRAWIESTLVPFGLPAQPMAFDGVAAPRELKSFHAVFEASVGPGFLHGISTWISPGIVTLRPDEFPDGSARAWASLLGVTGQILMFSGRLETLPADRVEMLKRVLPPVPARPVDLHAWGDLRIAALAVEKSGDVAHVAGVFNPTASPESIDLDPADLGLEAAPDRRLLAFDFWARKPLGIVAGKLRLDVPAESARVIVLREASATPTWLATSRHIAQGWFDLDAVVWDETAGALLGSSTVVGNDPYTIWFALPEGAAWSAGPAEAKGEDGKTLETKASVEGAVAALSFTAPKSQEVRWKLALRQKR